VGAPEDKRHHYCGCSAVNSPQSQGGIPEVVEARGQPRLPPPTWHGRPQPNSSSLTGALTSRSSFDWWTCIIAVFGFRTAQQLLPSQFSLTSNTRNTCRLVNETQFYLNRVTEDHAYNLELVPHTQTYIDTFASQTKTFYILKQRE
jgi:hypothetical protein